MLCTPQAPSCTQLSRHRYPLHRAACHPLPALQSAVVPSLLVFGGNGYVGSHVCQEALAEGIPVTSVSRSGRPSNDDREWVGQVHWLAADALQPETYRDALRSCLAVVSCVGLLSTNQDAMRRMNGDANVAIVTAAADAGVSRVAYISAHDYQFPGDLLVLKGYFQGKRDAEAALAAHFGSNGAPRIGFRNASAGLPSAAGHA
jgi:uncharacterized protein YbjT (DUF2867 family)